jgi:predicted TIM-barrel fold metal-dependent hydrolase
MRNGFRVIDADGHFYEPEDLWDKYLSPEFQDRRPKVARMLGNSMVQFEGEEGGVSRSDKLFSQMDAKFGHAFRDGWTLESRIKDMDTEGWDIQVCLPTKAVSLPGFIPDDVQGAMCVAYNSWAHDFCSGAPERIKFTATVPGHDIDDMVAEIRRSVSELGAVSVFLPKAIPEKMWHHPDYTKVWETVTELDVPISVHGSSSASGDPWANARYNPYAGPFIALGQAIGFPFENMINLGHFMYSGILDKFPNLKLLILEANSGWVPFWLNRLEKYCEGRQSVFFDEHPLDLTPQEYFLRQCAVAADADEPSIKYVVDYIGDDNIVFNTDYPHPDAPATNEPLANMMEQPLSEDTKRKILWDNSVKIYGERLVAGHPHA